MCTKKGMIPFVYPFSGMSPYCVRRRWQTCSMTLILFGILSIILGVQSQDPLYKLVSHRTLVSSSKPWRNSPSRNYGGGRTNPQQRPYQYDYSEKFLDFDAVLSDPRARIYSVDMKRRRPNEFSINSQLVALTLAAFCCQVWRPTFTQWGMKLSDRILRGEQLYRLITPIFLHGGIFHLFTNMVSLQRVGNDVEKLFGSGRYLATYIAAGVAGNIVSAIQSPNPSLGASGAVFGVVGAYFVYLSRHDWLFGKEGEAMTTSIGQTVATNVLLGFFMPQIDQWAHFGGIVGGGLMAYAFGPRLYISDIPIGRNAAGIETTRRVVIDRPILRAPSYIESIPSKVGTQWDRLTLALDTHVMNRVLPQGSKPWHINTSNNHYNKIKKRLPTRSIRPGPVD